MRSFLAAAKEAFILVGMAVADNLHFAQRQKLDLLVLSPDEKVQLRLQQLGHRFRLTQKRYSNHADYQPESTWFGRIPLALVENAEEIAPLHEERPATFLTVLSSQEIPEEQWRGIAASGAAGFMTAKDFFETVKFDFLCLQKIRAAYFPISIQDIFPMTEMLFNGSIRLPLNQKYLTVLFKGFLLTEEKYKRIVQEGRLFIRTRETADYLRYILNYNDGLGIGMRKRCRAIFLCLSAQYLDFLELLAVEGLPERAERLRANYQGMQDLCQEILGYIRSRGDVDLWDVFQGALMNEIFEYWRGPWRAVYAGLISEMAKQGDPLDAMMAALLWDISSLELDRDTYYDYTDAKKDLKNFDQAEIQNLPARSWALGQERGLTWKESLQPVFNDQTAPEYWIVKAADIVDRGSRSFMTENNVTFQYLRKTYFEQKIQGDPEFPPEIAAAMAPIAL